MTIAATLLPEFDQEMKTTRKVLERVPTDRGTWKPHEKSFSIGHLAQLLSWMPGWITSTLTQGSLDLATAPLVHHRGQMSVYLRLLDIPVPSLYGPTADEPWTG